MTSQCWFCELCPGSRASRASKAAPTWGGSMGNIGLASGRADLSWEIKASLSTVWEKQPPTMATSVSPENPSPWYTARTMTASSKASSWMILRPGCRRFLPLQTLPRPACDLMPAQGVDCPNDIFRGLQPKTGHKPVGEGSCRTPPVVTS